MVFHSLIVWIWDEMYKQDLGEEKKPIKGTTSMKSLSN